MAKEFPAVKFAIVDAVVDLPMSSIVVQEHEGSFRFGIALPWSRRRARSGSSGAWTSR